MAPTPVSAAGLLRRAEECLAKGQLLSGIQDAEQALQLQRKLGDPGEFLSSARAMLADSQLIDEANAQSERELERVERLLSHADRLQPEEWVLVVSSISSAQSLRNLCGALGINLPQAHFLSLLDSLRAATNGFRHKRFRQALFHAAQHSYVAMPAEILEVSG